MKIDTKQKITLRLEQAGSAEEASREGAPIDVYDLQAWLSDALGMMGFRDLGEAIRRAAF